MIINILRLSAQNVFTARGPSGCGLPAGGTPSLSPAGPPPDQTPGRTPIKETICILCFYYIGYGM